jgi:hypothetical protein
MIPLVTGTKMPLSNAERQRRYIQRLKASTVTNGASVTPVTDEPPAQTVSAEEFERRVAEEVKRRLAAAPVPPWAAMGKSSSLPPDDAPEDPTALTHAQRAVALY